MDIKNGVYQHFKGGHVYVMFTAKHSDREELEVVYKGLNNGKFYARPVESFTEIVKDSEDNEVSRFSYIDKTHWKDIFDISTINELEILDTTFSKENENVM